MPEGPPNRETRAVVLFTKAGVPGRVKTRLAPSLGANDEGLARAARLHRAFVADVLSCLSAGPFESRIAWSRDLRDQSAKEPPPGFAWQPQVGADLGERLFHGLLWAAEEAESVLAIGSDHPDLDAGVLDRAFRHLESGAPVVLGPVPDGGYYLIGMRREVLCPRLFEDLPWSTDRVFELTVARCRELGHEPTVLPGGHDVDTGADLEELIGRLRRHPGRCPATRSVLTEWGMMEPADR